MRAPRRLRQLVRIAEQHDAVRARRDRERVRKRELTGLVDEEDVDGLLHVRTREEPGRSTDHVDVLTQRAGHVLRFVPLRPQVARALVLVGLLTNAHVDATSFGSLPDLVEEVPDDGMALRDHANLLALRDEIECHLGAHTRLARPRWPLDRQTRPLEQQDDAARGLVRSFVRQAEWGAGGADGGSAPQQDVSSRARVARPVDATCDRRRRDPPQRVFQLTVAVVHRRMRVVRVVGLVPWFRSSVPTPSSMTSPAFFCVAGSCGLSPTLMRCS